MKIAFGLILFMFPMLSFGKANIFEVYAKQIEVNGSLNAQPRKIRLKANQPTAIAKLVNPKGGDWIIELTAADDASSKKDAIAMTLAVIEEKNSTRKVIAAPKIIAHPGQEASLVEGSEGDELFIKITLVGNRVQ